MHRTSCFAYSDNSWPAQTTSPSASCITGPTKTFSTIFKTHHHHHHCRHHHHHHHHPDLLHHPLDHSLLHSALPRIKQDNNFQLTSYRSNLNRPGLWHITPLSRVWSPYSAFPVPPRPERAITTQGADLRAWLRQHQDPAPPDVYREAEVCGSHFECSATRHSTSPPFTCGWIDPIWTSPSKQYFSVLPILEFKSKLRFGDYVPPPQRRACFEQMVWRCSARANIPRNLTRRTPRDFNWS